MATAGTQAVTGVSQAKATPLHPPRGIVTRGRGCVSTSCPNISGPSEKQDLAGVEHE